MKKFFAILLTVAMMTTMTMTAFAQDITGESGSTDITYTANESYTVTIPDSMRIGTDETVSVSNVTLAAGKQLTVSVSSTQYDNGWKLKNNDDTIGYTLKINDTDVASGDTILTAKTGETPSATLATALTGAATYAGTYSDTLTFTVATAAVSDVEAVSTADALNTAFATGGKYKLEGNIALTDSANELTSRTTVELDLNGKKYEGYFPRIDGKLVISDSGDSGSVYAAGEMGQIQCYGELVVNGGFFQCRVNLNHGGTMTVNGGQINELYPEFGTTLTVNGGQINELDTTSGLTLTITGGTVKFANKYDQYGTIVITGGTFNINPENYVDTDNYTITDNGDSTWTVTAK